MADTIFSNPPNNLYTESEPIINVEEFIKIVQTRRSVRIFEHNPIPEHIMNSCFDLALLAPNSSNLQPWEFYWVRSHAKKNALVEACLSQPAAKTAAELIVFVSRIDSWKKNRKKMLEILESKPKVPDQAIDFYKRLVPFAYTQGLFNLIGLLKKIAIFIYGLRKAAVREPTSKSEMIIWATKSTCLACENFMLALRAYSYDSCPMEGFDSKRIKKILNLPNDAYVTMVIGAGKRASNGIYGPRIRFNRKNFIKEV